MPKCLEDKCKLVSDLRAELTEANKALVEACTDLACYMPTSRPCEDFSWECPDDDGGKCRIAVGDDLPGLKDCLVRYYRALAKEAQHEQSND